MNFKFLEDFIVDSDEIRIQYHPDCETVALDMKEFLMFQMQNLTVVDEYHQQQTIPYALIYSLCLQDQKVMVYGECFQYQCLESFKTLKDKLQSDYFILINHRTMINCCYIRKIEHRDRIKIILENQQIFYCDHFSNVL